MARAVDRNGYRELSLRIISRCSRLQARELWLHAYNRFTHAHPDPAPVSETLDGLMMSEQEQCTRAGESCGCGGGASKAARTSDRDRTYGV
jgi:hypothetical protein